MAGPFGPRRRRRGPAAAHQPFTPVIDTLRGLLTGTPSGGSAIAAVVWCAGLAIPG